MEKETILEVTQSLCPVCRKILDARVVEESGSVYMVKNCPEHGAFKVILSKYAWYYKGLNSLYDKLSPAGHPLTNSTVRGVVFHPTSKCNLNCSICFSHTKGDSGMDVSLDEVAKMVNSIKGRKAIAILGGEPTVHKNIIEIVRIFSRAGHFVKFYTNGIKISDLDYLKKLKESGVGIVHIGVDTLTDDDVYQRMRGKALLEYKKKALSNLKTLRVKTGMLDVAVKGLNEKHIFEIVDFVMKNRFVHELSIRGYSHIGRKGFSTDNEFTMDELVETFEKQTNGLVTLEEFYTFQKISYILRAFLYGMPQCYVKQRIYIPRGRRKKTRDVFPPDVFEEHIKTFENIFAHDPRRAKMFFLSKIFARAPHSPSLFFQHGLAGKVAFFDARYYAILEFATFYTPYNLDLTKTKKRCWDAWLPSYAEGKFEDYCSVLSNTTGL